MLKQPRDLLAGILDKGPAGACTRLFPVYATSRIVAGGPIEGGIFKCFLQPVDVAVARGLYGPWTPTPGQVARLGQIFPDGVCDYTKGDAGLPPELRSRGRQTFGTPLVPGMALIVRKHLILMPGSSRPRPKATKR